jgi:hypothetical protein
MSELVAPAGTSVVVAARPTRTARATFAAPVMVVYYAGAKGKRAEHNKWQNAAK